MRKKRKKPKAKPKRKAKPKQAAPRAKGSAGWPGQSSHSLRCAGAEERLKATFIGRAARGGAVLSLHLRGIQLFWLLPINGNQVSFVRGGSLQGEKGAVDGGQGCIIAATIGTAGTGGGRSRPSFSSPF